MTYGLVSVFETPREASICRVYVNGIDVTGRCQAANDREGWADCLVKNAEGKYFLEGDSVKRERLHGRVVIEFPRGLD